jgi:type I restriction enzyme S subunit
MKVPLSELTGPKGLFCDGDWVESKDQDQNGEVRLVQLADVGVGEWLDKSSRFLTRDKAAELGCTFLQPGDLLIARMPDPIGRACIFPGSTQPCVTVVDVCILRVAESVDRIWLMHALNSPDFRRSISRFVNGTTRSRISRSKLGSIELHIPPLEEQKRIAAILDKADAIRRKREQAIELADEFLRSLFLDMFGDPVTNPKGWPVAELGELTDIHSGSTPSRDDSENYGGDIPWVTTAEVNGRTITDTNEKVTAKGVASARLKLFPANSILVALYGQGKTRGRCALLGIPATTNQACGVLLPTERFLPIFMHTQLSLAYARLRALARGGNQANLNLGLLGSFVVLLPSLEDQQSFVHCANAIAKVQTSNQRLLQEGGDLLSCLNDTVFRSEPAISC